MPHAPRPKFDPQKHHRRSIRLPGYDYSQEGAYYVTIVTQGRECLFGEIVNGEMHLNKYGEIVQKWWNEIPIHFPNVELGVFIIMPNHVHGIIFITTERRGEVVSPHDNPNNNIQDAYVDETFNYHHPRRRLMEIKDKTPNDPIANLYLVDAYMRWALLAAEEVVGKQGLTVLLRERGLERFIDNYPPELLKISGGITLGDYAQLCAGLLTFFGRAGKSMVIRCGRLTSKYAIEKQSSVYNVAAKTAAKLMPSGLQVKLVLDSMANGYNKLYADSGQELHFRVEDRSDKWAFISVECPLCAGKAADLPMCWGRIGTLKEGLFWLTGKDFDVEEVECRAVGASACVWEVSKTPKE